MTPMQKTKELGTEFWNDSCALIELGEAIDQGATGATSNPVIVLNVVKSDPTTWNPVLEKLIKDHSAATEDEIAWLLIEEMGRRAAALLLPLYEKSQGAQGYLSMQVNPKYYRNPDEMVRHAHRLVAIAPNIAIKAPLTKAGLIAMERMTGEGITVNATVSFTVSQAVAMAEGFERGIQAAQRAGKRAPRPYVTLMVGRLDDHMGRLLAKGDVTVDPGVVHWAGVAAFKKSYEIFQKRGYQSRLLAAAYRHHLHWTELVGKNVVMTMPFNWWKQFNKSDLVPSQRIETPVRAEVWDALIKFGDFKKALDERGLAPEEFDRFGATTHTLNQFLTGYQDLLALVRQKMI